MLHWPWYLIAIGVLILLVAGLVGALIQSVMIAYLNQKVPIGHRIEVFPAFGETLGANCVKTQIFISDGQKEYGYEVIRMVQIRLVNEGLYDLSELELRIDCSDKNNSMMAIYLEAQSPDRSHQVKQLTPLSFNQPQSTLNLLLRPMNRGDRYSLRLLMVDENCCEAVNLCLSSPQPVRFVERPILKEAVKEAARSTSLSLGPFQVSFDR